MIEIVIFGTHGERVDARAHLEEPEHRLYAVIVGEDQQGNQVRLHVNAKQASQISQELQRLLAAAQEQISTTPNL